ncbi:MULTISPECIES: helix-turn-helix domain-containing protein [Duganella]|uniref:Transcriptional regulator with XRE-family HTH domain n=1 Tax=Duganella violaceipulchra TaxID=2849652 RepID=A0ABT1GWQ3_9BURK|nr:MULTISPECIES: helix-turn-helix transcriptional regulator [Duganella]MCP2012709.1 transcriptional regulator with XRE-family HTH domain [Duganella violaceicalia]
MDDPAIAFGVVLRALRKEAGLSQEQLGLEAGVERNYVSLIERGINQPSIRVIFKLCAALDVRASSVIEAVEKQLESSTSKVTSKRR